MVRVLGAILFLVSLSAAKADVLYSDSTESGGVLQFSSSSQNGSIGSGSGLSYYVGFAFVLPTGTYDDIGFDFAGEQFGSGTTTASIYSDSGGSPSSVLASTTFSPSTSTFALASGSFTPSFTLTGGTTYYFVVSSTASQVTWVGTPLPLVTGTEYFGVHYSSGTTLWNAYSGQDVGAFDITGDAAGAPEPATVAEALGGLLLLALARRISARRNQLRLRL